MNKIYEKLRNKMDHMSIGFPHTPNGDEYNLLQEAFTVEEAEYAFALTTEGYDTALALAERMGKTEAETSKMLEAMTEKGLIFFRRKDGKREYRFVPWTVGILECQLNIKKKPEFLQKMGAFMMGGFGKGMWGNKTPLFRYVPVNTDLVTDCEILPQDDVMHLIDTKDPKRIANVPCMCRQNAGSQGRPCKHEGFDHTCLYFNEWADFYVERGDGRYITPEEAKDLLRRAEKEGLVIETANNELANGDVICMCCGCCCGPLRMMRLFPGEALKKASNHYVVKEDGKCIGCETCIKRCPTEAMYKEGNLVKLNVQKCIGCGVCISTCITKALKLKTKGVEDLNLVTIPNLDMLQDTIQREYRTHVDNEGERNE